MKIRRILIGYGLTRYGVLNTFILELAEGFKKRGIEVEVINLNEKSSLEIFDKEYSLILSFNGMMKRESFIKRIVRSKNIIVWSFFVDHPLYHSIQLLEDSRFQIVSCVDRKQVEYIKKYYKNNRYVTFMPHAGIKVDYLKKFEEKSHDVSLFGSYSASEKLEKAFVINFNENMKQLLMKLADNLYNDYTLSMEEGLIDLLEKYNIILTEKELRDTMVELGFVDQYVRYKKRHDVVEALLKKGIVVDVYGNGWEEFETEYKENLKIHGAIEFKDALYEISESKIVLNVMPLFPDGSHERVFTTMCAKSICFTDRSLYLEECFEDKKELFFYSINDLEDLADQVKAVLRGDYNVEEILENAYRIVMEKHLWQNRADEILEYAENLLIKRNQVVEENTVVDYEFNQLFEYLQNIEEEQLKEKMLASYYWMNIHAASYLEKLGNSFQTYPYWGSWKPENNEFGVIDERVVQLKRNSDKFIWLYNRLEDTTSKLILKNVLLNWETLNPNYLKLRVGGYYKHYFDQDILKLGQHEVFIDLGAYRGETVLDFLLETRQKFDKIICYEFSKNNTEILEKEYIGREKILIRKCAIGEKHGWVSNQNQNDDCSSDRMIISDMGEIECVSLDEDVKEKVTFIKADIEGAEYQALLGARKHIINEHPKLAISIYHGNEDIWRLAKLIDEMDSSYHFFIRYYGGNLYPNEIVLYAV